MRPHQCATCSRSMTPHRIRKGSWVAVLDRSQGAYHYYCHTCSADALATLVSCETAFTILTDPLRFCELVAA